MKPKLTPEQESKGQLEVEERDAPMTTKKEARFVSLVQGEMSSDSAPDDSFRPHFCYGSKTDPAASDLDAGVLPVTLVNSEFRTKKYGHLRTSPSADSIATRREGHALSVETLRVSDKAATAHCEDEALPVQTDLFIPDAEDVETVATKYETRIGLFSKALEFARSNQLIHLLLGLVLICIGRMSSSWM